MATLLICLAPNLSSLHLDPLFTVETDIFVHIHRHSLFSQPGSGYKGTRIKLPPFPKLRNLSMCSRFDEIRRTDLNNTADILPVFYLEALESLKLSLDNPTEFAWPTTSPPTADKLSSLELQRVREQMFSPILAAMPVLKSLTWTCRWINTLDRGVNTSTMDLDAMTSALAPLRDSLINFTINTYSLYLGNDSRLSKVHLVGSLAGLDQLHCLRRLRIP